MSKAFLLSVTENRSFGETFLSLDAALVNVAEDGTPRNITGGSLSIFDTTELGLADFHVDAQNSGEHARYGYPAGQAYAWEFGIKPIGLARSEQVIAAGKVAAKVQRRLDALTARFGTPEDFGAYLLRVADALGVTEAIVGNAGSDGNYSTGFYRVMPIAQGADWLRAADRSFIVNWMQMPVAR